MATDIFVIGAGIKAVQHLTLEAVQALQSCKTVFTVDHGFGVLEYIRSLGPRVVDLIPEYKEGRHRLETYQHMAARVIAEARKNPPVAFLTYGHPQWLVFPTELIADAARRLDLNVTAIAGISCIDTVVLELGIDPAARGLQIFEATGLVTSNTPIVASVPCIVLQTEAFRNETYTLKRQGADRFSAFVDYLRKFYPADHKILSVYSATHPLMKPVTIEFALADLASVFERATVSGTIYIPPLVNAAPAASVGKTRNATSSSGRKRGKHRAPARA
jgi:precorrin-2 methylase